ncbi:uncharacterized protein PHALS_13105 [Plasmopara halstedii]|uniref:Uncharacterized protein n=1 Tax=Plasmopara halstedii TaxID=4781 RepID=A0A0P1APZ2_PLAHL|nr:uncharacterized protein PHALS_13105 [Plasmopara halstedii]CEG42868.1 hypothetical protein PHALS_13105 [Plasmopara halstedii]|eukprot:XP_024579237.1 hypothetical protein PHALS_13105 [Plasmopara halstedii]
MDVMVDGSMTNSRTKGKYPSRGNNTKATKTSFTSSILRDPDQGASCTDIGSVQEYDTLSEFIDVVAYNEEGDVDIFRHVKIEIPPCLVKELIFLPLMSKKTRKRSQAKGEILKICATVEETIDDEINTAEEFDKKTRKVSFDEQSWDALTSNLVYEVVKE